MTRPPAECIYALRGSYARALKLGPAWLIVTDEEAMLILPASAIEALSTASAKELRRLAAAFDKAVAFTGPAREDAQAELYDLLVRTYLDLLEGALPAKPAGVPQPKPARRTSSRKGKTK